MISIRPPLKAAIVLGGFAFAAAMAWVAVAMNQWLTQGPDAQASSGMHAFGDLVLGVGVFCLVASVPLVLGLVWLRPVARFWIAAAWVAGLYAATGPVALLVSGWLRQPASAWAMLSDARIGLMPLGAPGLLIGGAFAPMANQRWLLIFAAILEGAIFAAIVLFHFILPNL